ncbi:MAG: restriction endonuclease [Acidobacteria bacterium]|nr:restriction endonuclease [Acidobacteriota bacterium]
MNHLNYPYATFAAQSQTGRMAAVLASVEQMQHNNALLDTPTILLQAVIIPGEKTAEGQLIESVAFAWFDIIELIQRSPEAIYEIDWRKWEEIIAGAYSQQGFDVVLTPRSNDKGRDIIATSKTLGSICFFDQVKAYRPGHVVTLEEVSAMVGILNIYPNVSKGLITTTSSFAPGVLKDPDIARFVPYRLELKWWEPLLQWLADIAAKEK